MIIKIYFQNFPRNTIANMKNKNSLILKFLYYSYKSEHRNMIQIYWNLDYLGRK